jgi:proteasome accessory factor C
MSDTAAAQLRRILTVIPQLADGHSHSVAEIAERVGVDVDTLRRDLWSIVTRFDAPGGFVEGVQLYLEADSVELISSHFHRPMRLTVSELCALELGLAVLATQAAPDEVSAIERTRARLRQAIMQGSPKERNTSTSATDLRHVSIGGEGLAYQLGAIRAALRTHHKLRIAYRRGDATTTTVRVVCPYALVTAHGAYYLIGFCEASEGVRVFRVDRIEEMTRTEDPYEMPPSFSLDGIARDGRVLDTHGPATMTVRYSPRIARWIAERERGTTEDDGSFVVQHPLADVAWGVRHVLQYGPDAEVLAPDEVRDAVVERLRAMVTA